MSEDNERWFYLVSELHHLNERRSQIMREMNEIEERINTKEGTGHD